MSEWFESLFSELAAIFSFSLIFGGLIVLPFFAVWIFLVFRFKQNAYFLGAWIPLLVLSAVLSVEFLGLVQSIHEEFHDVPKDPVTGPIAPFPGNLDASVILVTIPTFSSFLSPLLVVVVLFSWERYRKSKRP